MTLQSVLNCSKAVLNGYGIANLDMGKDTQLFLDPLKIAHFNPRLKDILSRRYEIFNRNQTMYSEVKEAGLGYSNEGSEGHGIAVDCVKNHSLYALSLYHTIPGVAKDAMSDVTSNLIKGELISSTTDLIAKLRSKGIYVPTKNYEVCYWEFTETKMEQVQVEVEMLVGENDEPRMLVPLEFLSVGNNQTTVDKIKSLYSSEVGRKLAEGYEEEEANEIIVAFSSLSSSVLVNEKKDTIDELHKKYPELIEILIEETLVNDDYHHILSDELLNNQEKIPTFTE